ncbi:MAG: hypothetical protein MAG451_00151 [Anaerolineales bacterium]|nr:hypothetical protein [Anaerolineales bacterium]
MSRGAEGRRSGGAEEQRGGGAEERGSRGAGGQGGRGALRKTFEGLVVLALSAFFATAVFAQAPTKERQFVYGVNAFTGSEYVGTFYPTTQDTLYLLADTRSIISPRYTLVYFWPITNEYKADWDSLNETVAGALEILRQGKVLHTLSQTKYVIQHPHGLDAGEVHLYTGQEAKAQHQEFQRQRDAYRDRVWEYYQAEREYQEQLSQIVTQGKSEADVNIPDPPDKPEPFLFYSTGLNDGFPVELAAGAYVIRIRGADGQILPQSKRKLVVFSAQREGVGYTVVSRDKWTTPEQVDDPNQVIYVRSGSTSSPRSANVLYFQPFLEREYNELYYTRLKTPQSMQGRPKRRPNRWMWVHLQPKGEGHMEVLHGDRVIQSVEKKPYRVRQLPGPALGYEVVEYGAGGQSETRSPDFEGYRIQVEAGQPSYTLRLVEADGSVVRGSEREIRVANTQNPWLLYLAPALPLVVGASLAVWRRRKVAALPRQGELGGKTFSR